MKKRKDPGAVRSLAALFLMITFIGVAVTAQSPLIQEIQDGFAVTKSDMGAFTALTFVGGTAGLIALILLADRVSRVLILSVSSVLCAAMFLAMAFSGKFSLLLLWTLFYGLAFKNMDSCTNSLVADRFPDDILRCTNLLHFFASAGAIAAPFLIALAKAKGAGWRPIEGSLGILSAAVILVFLLLWRPRSGQAAEKCSAGASGPGRSWFRDKEIYFIGAIIFLYGMHQIGISTWTSVFFASMPVPQAVADFSASFLWIGILIGRLIAIRFRAERTALRYILWGSLISGAALTAAVAMRRPVPVLAAYILSGILTGALIPTMVARTNRRFPARAGSATTFLFLAMMIGQIVVAYGTGSIADRLGIGPAMLLSSFPLAAVFFVGAKGGLLRRA